MSKVDNINIKLEVFKDKSSGKLSIMAHFDSNAPNVFEEKDGVFWMPTIEENDLLNDAFEFIPLDGGSIPPVKKTPEPEEIKKEEPLPEPEIQEQTEPAPEPEPQLEIEPTPEIKEEKPVDLPPLENPTNKDVFEVTDENIKKDDMEKEPEQQIEQPSYDEPAPEEPPSEEKENKIKEDQGLIVEADSDAIEAALKKHTDAKEEGMVEADEQTIIDKVLSQKKKGKWSKK